MGDRRRVFGPKSRGFPGHDMVKQERSQLLAVIHNSYEAARTQHRLPAEAGYCLGLLDPVSTLAINVSLASSGAEAADDLERRSLDGMVVFLTTFFPGLTDWEAVHFLSLARADLLGAACIILKDRAMETTTGHVESMVRTALKCAAVAAAHPDPDSLVDAWLSLSPSLDSAVALLAATTPTAARLRALADSAAADIDMEKAWQIAAYRQLGITGGDDDVPFYHQTRSLRRALLDKIHRRYLQVLARLPRRELRCRYHRALLAAGSCYGPFSDPESNVILNTVWYDTMFPTRRSEQLELDVFTTSVLGRAACRSLCGLVSFLCTRYGTGLSEHDAIRRLLDADADLHAAARDAERRGHRPCSSTREAYEAAATAARHPHATVQAAFLDSGFEDAAALLPAPHELITSESVVRLAEQLSPVPAPQPAPPKRGTKLYWAVIRQRRRRFRAHEGLAVSLVKASLAEQDAGDGYELHVVCGVSVCVIGPDHLPDTEDVVYHINFLATKQQGPPVLFFAECSKKGPATVCRPVNMPLPRASLVRCLHCEEEGGKIIHPASAEFHGRVKEFEEAARGGMSSLSNSQIITRSEYAGQCMYSQLQEDAIYVDSDGGSSSDDDEILALADYDDNM